ncbi:UNVERIFIED_CONTAM: hypothetical protein Sradi_4667400 [Sesamum radiatum]|uniref:TOD1/MUCI70 glycosyltransferase-like domain-containing protein n=1 Tax=Sesamum radiatum TaxID=300843 RepID=A0AAW2MV52_SESRA
MDNDSQRSVSLRAARRTHNQHTKALCNKDSKVFGMLNNMGLVTPPHRCPIPVADDPEKITIPKERTPDIVVRRLSYIVEDNILTNGSESSPLFGGHQNWQQREESFKIKPTMKVHCGFMQGGGDEMDAKDVEYVKRCRFVVATGIFDAYDLPHQPSNISKLREDNDGGQWVGIWRLVLLKQQPYDEPRRNGKVPKILTHRLFPQAQYSIWIDGKMELILDPLLLLERLGARFKFFMFPNCEYNSIFILHPHTREHSSKVEWAKTMEEFKKHPELRESRGGLGLWTPYPGNLDLVVLPPVARTSKAG